MNFICISALTDNYIWLLYNNNNQCLIFDPGETKSVLQTILNKKLKPIAILLTHHHDDHVRGVQKLLDYFSIPVYGPEETRNKGTSKIVSEGDKLLLLNHQFEILELPGHTLGHIGFYSKPWFFCGDTMFSAGCGKILEGTPKQLYKSIQKINKLPLNTQIYAAHEYTLNNLKFAITLLPKDNVLINYQRIINKLRIKNEASLPTTLYLERYINLFLRCNDIIIQKKLNINNSKEWQIFAQLRKIKDHF